MRPALVSIRLRDLRIAEEFLTSLGHAPGVVFDWGYVVDVDRTGRQTRVRAVKVRFGTVEQILHAEVLVLVPFDRPHARHERGDERWSTPLETAPPREPFNAPRIAC